MIWYWSGFVILCSMIIWYFMIGVTISYLICASTDMLWWTGILSVGIFTSRVAGACLLIMSGDVYISFLRIHFVVFFGFIIGVLSDTCGLRISNFFLLDKMWKQYMAINWAQKKSWNKTGMICDVEVQWREKQGSFENISYTASSCWCVREASLLYCNEAYTSWAIKNVLPNFCPYLRAATNILTKIRNFRDLRTCQKGPKLCFIRNQMSRQTTLWSLLLLYMTILDIKNVNILIKRM